MVAFDRSLASNLIEERRSMPREVALAILFADVSNSTQLYEALGDIRARDIVRR